MSIKELTEGKLVQKDQDQLSYQVLNKYVGVLIYRQSPVKSPDIKTTK